MTATTLQPMDDATFRHGVALLERAFSEDLGPERIDLTAAALDGVIMRAVMVARQDGVACGVNLAAEAFRMRGVEPEPGYEHARHVRAGDELLHLHGDAAAILSAERTALNVVQRLSGVATLTSRFVAAIAGSDAQILDTRKTEPGNRLLQRYAVRMGGGTNHRFGLFDEAMLKDNHIAACGGITAAVARVRNAHPDVRIHVEADELEQVREAVDAGADVVLLDNMTTDQLREAMTIIDGRALAEASGGVHLDTVAAIAATGVQRISVGAITHSAPAFDLALDAVLT